ncbi:hypothetical protein AB0K66_19560 [Streptomyces werraensis]|uniref:hypothetical protein n=1 Tax=Streptomyces werraensis TaxID=68284 RepID=UPI00167C3482|nr:hypothetical protein [Streptomyces werraensis]
MRASRVVASVLTGAALVLGVAASPASAADGWQATADADDSTFGQHPYECDDFAGGEACFQPYGEWFWVRDLSADNLPVAMVWSYSDDFGSRQGVAYDTLGKARGWTNLNKSFEEYGSLFWQVCSVTSVAKKQINWNSCSDGQSSIT